MNINRRGGLRQGQTSVKQARLVFFDLDNHLIAGLFSRLERFFWQ